MKILKIVLFLILGFNVNAQIELFQLQWATDSSYVIGALPSGEPIWVHVDSLGIADSIYFSGGRVYLRDGSGSALIPVPSVTGTISGHQIGVFNSGTGDPTTPIRETVTTFSGIASGVRTYTSEDGTMYDLDAESTNELQELNLLDSTDRVFTLEITNGNIVKWKDQVGSGVTQYLNPYVITGDTVGFYLTVAVDTVLFENTIDTAAYCCPPSISGDTLFIAENYVQLPKENLIGGWGITATESPDYTWNIIADTSQVATQYDLTLIGGSQTLSIDSTNRVFTIGISGGNTVKFKDTGGIDSTTVVNGYGTTITESPANQFNITVDSSKFATVYDLTQVSGSNSKVIDILGSDFTTSATSLQTTDLAYTFPSTGTYEVKLYGTYTSSNTANGISFGYVESGGLTASFVTGSHYVYDRGTTASGSTMAIRGVSALGHVIATSSVVTANSPLTIMSEILVTVSATGTLTFKFASESGSYSATLVAGSSLIIEKLD